MNHQEHLVQTIVHIRNGLSQPLNAERETL